MIYRINNNNIDNSEGDSNCYNY